MKISQKLNKEELIQSKKRSQLFNKFIDFCKVLQFLMICYICYSLLIKSGF